MSTLKTFPLSRALRDAGCAVLALFGLCAHVPGTGLATAAEGASNIAPAKTQAAIPWSQLGAKAGADYKGDGLAVVPTAGGARLRCVFQRLEGEATREGLWLTSTATNTVKDRFRIMAAAVGRVTPCAPGPLPDESHNLETRDGAHGVTRPTIPLASQGTVSIDGQVVRFIRPGLIEEYSVSMDGVRQDFVVPQQPAGAGELAVRLAVIGARVEVMAGGARLVLENSGRRIAYNRLRVTDAKGRELTARMEVSDKSEIRNPKSEMGFAVLVNDADAVYPVRIDPTFSDANWISMGGIPGVDGIGGPGRGWVQAVVADGLGNLYVGGSFFIAGNVLATNIAKWNGTTWSALGSGTEYVDDRGFFRVVNALAVSGSNVYAGGLFATAGGIVVSNIAKWNGSSWSALGSGMSGPSGAEVYTLAVSGSDLYVGGYFETAGGIAATNIAKWDGSNWGALGSGIGGSDASVNALAVSGSDLYVGGGFTTAGGNPANGVAKWDGSNWSALGLGMGGYYASVNALAVSGSDLYAGGFFTTADGYPANNIARWDGYSWWALGPGIGFSGIYALAVSGSDLYAGGLFTTFAGGLNYIAKWDGGSWSALGSGMGGRPNNPFDGGAPVYALAVWGSNLYAGGEFTIATNSGGVAVPVTHIAQWNGSSWAAVGWGMGFPDRYNNETAVGAVALLGSDLYVGGKFTTVGGIPANCIAKWDGSSWSALGSGMNAEVDALAVSGSSVYAGGYFTNAGGIAANYIAKWDGSSWSALGSGMTGNYPAGLYPGVDALALSGSDLYAGGSFIMAGGIAASNIAKWDGSSWSALGSGVRGPYQGSVGALAVSGSDLYAGGYFTTAGGIVASNIAKWNGSSWSALGTGMGGDYDSVRALAVSGSDLYAGGEFTSAGGIAANHIAKWNGSSWSALGSGVEFGSVAALAVSGSDLYVGGNFTTAGGIAATNIAKWNGSSWSALGSGVDLGYVYELAVWGSDLYVGGDFWIAGGKASAFLAKAIVNPPILAIEPDGFGGYFIDFRGVPGSAYRLQRAQTLSGPWISSAPHTAPTNGLLQFWDLFPPPGQGFYRSVQP